MSLALIVSTGIAIIGSVRGDVIPAVHPQYDSVRMTRYGMHDQRPVLIARCTSPEDVAVALAVGKVDKVGFKERHLAEEG